MKIIRKLKYPLTVILIFGIIIITYLIKKNLNNKQYEVSTVNIEDNLVIEEVNQYDKEEKLCNVDIKGAVVNPGVYEIICTKYVNDAIKAAGGLTDNANTSVINLAKRVVDEMVIIIYTNDEVKNSNVVDTVIKYVDKECNCPNIKNDSCVNTEIDKKIGDDNNLLVNINEATLEELQTISGIGESKAKAILEYRNNYGAFKTIDEILNVSGIGENLYEQIKIYITT